MVMERTFSIIKPDVTKRNLTGLVNSKIEASGLRIIAQKRVWFTKKQAQVFYAIHSSRPFFDELVESITSAPVIVQVLAGEDAISSYRKLMGATNPKEAEDGTIRKEFAISIGENSVHGSDSADNALKEISQWFAENEIVG